MTDTTSLTDSMRWQKQFIHGALPQTPLLAAGA